MSSSWGRAQTEPIAALAAVFALGVGLSLYAGAFDATAAELVTDREMAPHAADRLVAETTTFGAVVPPLAEHTDAASPRGYRLNASLRTDEGTWTEGRPRAPDPECVDRRVAVRVAPARVIPGLLEVCVWPAA
ncbi:DUF7285 family protein [Natronomonas marina]|jgi:hypothetical protein|uniref:DUF7285 family protein n=1 Tax=Natronomonas marina TaxID=2961939 RepID=UPI0020C9E2D8|nr:hypothetical protein [Natronomonas marina]